MKKGFKLHFGKIIDNLWYRHGVSKMQKPKIKKILQNFNFKNKKVLDFGCGLGKNSVYFDKNYIGVDIDKSRIVSARKTYPKKFKYIDPITKSNDKLPFKNNSFDVIFVSLCLHHIPPEQNKLIVKEFNRILKNNGIIIGLEPNITKKHKISNLLMKTFDYGEYITSEDNYKKYYTINNFKFTTKKYFTIGWYNCIYYECLKKKKI